MSGVVQTDEEVIGLLVLEVLGSGGIWENGKIKEELRSSPRLTTADKARSDSRLSEPKWHSAVNNVLTKNRGLYAQGFVENCGKGRHRITAAGVSRLAWHNQLTKLIAESGLRL